MEGKLTSMWNETVKIRRKIYIILIIFFIIIGVCMQILYVLNYVNGETASVFWGFTMLFSGLYQISNADQVNSKGTSKGYKKSGIFQVVAGMVVIISAVIKMMLYDV